MTQLSQRSSIMLEEPSLEFRYSQKVIDPKVGLTIFGPQDSDAARIQRIFLMVQSAQNKGWRKRNAFLQKSKTSLHPKHLLITPDSGRLFLVFKGRLIHLCQTSQLGVMRLKGKNWKLPQLILTQTRERLILSTSILKE